MSVLQHVQPLKALQRIEAETRADSVVVARQGKKPDRESFRSPSFGKYPSWLTASIIALIIGVLLTAFILSSMRLYHIGNGTFYETIPHARSAMIGGAAIVLLSELSSVLFMLGLSIIGDNNAKRAIMLSSAFATAALALSGNFYVALYQRHITVFSVLEAMLPPLITLSTAYVLKEVALKSVEQRQEDNLNFQKAILEYNQRIADPRQSPGWQSAYFNALREMLMEVNSITAKGNISRTNRTYMQSLTDADFQLLLRREMSAENWHDGYETAADLEMTQPGLPVYLEETTDSFLAPTGNGRQTSR